MIITTGKCKGMSIGDCDEKYLKWLAARPMKLAERNRWMSRDAVIELDRREWAQEEKAALARIAELEAAMAPVVVEIAEEPVIETSAPVERATRFDRDLCCKVYVDNGERVTPQIFVEGLGWVSPPNDDEVQDVEEGLSWSYAVRRSNSKSRMRAEANAIKNNKRKAFSILKV